MRSLAVFGGSRPPITVASAATINGIESWFGLLNYNVEPECGPYQVILRVEAFSCNYRDRTFIELIRKKSEASSYYILGSEFVGEVIATGAKVETLVPGDRVIADNAWLGLETAADYKGIPTNHASKEFQVFEENSLVKVPGSMPTEVAAAFSIGAQTSFSIIRRLQLTEGDKVLITSAGSNTSLFTINALRETGVDVYVTSSTRAFEDNFHELGVKEIAAINWADSDFTEVAQLVDSIGRFDAIIDPFVDVHLSHLIPFLRSGGRYITCGMSDSNEPSLFNPRPTFFSAIIDNKQILGNCLGTKEDLTNAIKQYELGRFEVKIDSIYDSDVGAFIDRTFTDKRRFGKVVFAYETSN